MVVQVIVGKIREYPNIKNDSIYTMLIKRVGRRLHHYSSHPSINKLPKKGRHLDRTRSRQPLGTWTNTLFIENSECTNRSCGPFLPHQVPSKKRCSSFSVGTGNTNCEHAPTSGTYNLTGN